MILTEANYHSAEANALYMSNSQLGQWIKCPARQAAILAGDWKEPEKDPKHFALGKLVDDLLTTPDKAMEELNDPECQYHYGNGKRYAWVSDGIAMADRCKRDKEFMASLRGTTQAILTFDWLGLLWKVKYDSISFATKSFTDLKTVGHALDKTAYDEELGVRVPFYQQFDYWRQMTVYRRGYIETQGHEPKRVRIAAVTSEDPPDIGLYEFRGDHNWRAEEKRIARYVEMIKRIKAGDEPAERCESCDYCRATRVLSRPITAEYFRQSDVTMTELFSGVKPK